MSDILKLLDSGVDDVKAGLAGLSHDVLLKLKAAESDGKTRKGVLEALDAALEAEEKRRAGGFVEGAGSNDPNNPPAIAAQLDGSAPADIPAADAFDPSGAPQQIVPDVDMSHPAVDADPRAGTTELQNRIDFNDPNKAGVDVVTEALASPDSE
jgi:hypothetical protein